MALNPRNSSNIFLFFGEDDFSLRRKIEHWKTEFAKKYSSSSISILNPEGLSEEDLIKRFRDEMAPSLFSTKKLIIVRNILPRKADSALSDFLLEFIPQIPGDFFVIFWEQQKPDGRLGFTKKFLNLITSTEFPLPHGSQLNQWIIAMTKNLGSEISPAAADRLAEFLGRDLFEEKKAGGRVIERKEAFDLWQVYSEIQKLTSKSSKIEVGDVTELVRPKVPDSVFAMTDEILARNKKGAFDALENFLAGQTVDEKSAFIKIIGLFSEQIRSLLLVSMLVKKGLNNDEIAEKLGWSSGRVFITAKNARSAREDKLKKLLSQLVVIDSKIKSSEVNSKLLVNIFITEAVS